MGYFTRFGICCFALSFGCLAAEENTVRTDRIKVADGFTVEHLYEVKEEEGSWVAMTKDGEGRLIVSDQYGQLYRVSVPPISGGELNVEKLDIPIGGAHGLLWHKGVLYLAINETSKVYPVDRGIWMVAETEEGWAKPEHVIPIKAGGEHGIHSLVLSPDEKWIYLVAGNMSDVPEYKDSFPAEIWAEDQLLERNPDGKGHAARVRAPAGWVGRFHLDGTNFELVSIGARNTFGIAFHDNGELISYDADMEWDFGMPWYRPTRICHVVPGSDFGWRMGTGKWPEYYEDSMGSLLNIGPGSPTSLIAGRGLKAPQKYQQAIFAFDWTFATIYAVHLEPEGASFRAEYEELASGAGLPLTGALIGDDGALYFATGGRRGESNLWRIVYTGDDAVAQESEGEEEREDKENFGKVEVRDRLAALIRDPGEGSTDDIEFSYDQMGSDDRTLRFMARAAIERFPSTDWSKRLEDETNPWRVITSSIALARLDAEQHRGMVMDKLLSLEWETMELQQQLNWLRALGLVMIRDVPANAEERDLILAKIDDKFPSKERSLNYELARLLCYLEAPDIVGRVLDMMDNSPPDRPKSWERLLGRHDGYGKDLASIMANYPPTTQIHYLYCLRAVKGPWKEDERARAFKWLSKIEKSKGGRSFAPAIAMIRGQIFENGTASEKIEFADQQDAPEQELKPLPKVEGPGRAWTVEEIVKVSEGNLEGRDHERGAKMFQAALCSACHKFGPEGGAQGPDLTNLSGRFTVTDLAHSIVDPSQVVSDQYEFSEIRTHNGGITIGRIMNEQDEILSIATNPFDFSAQVEISRADIASIEASKVSSMPPGLVNRLNEEELKDLLSYLLQK